MTQLQRERELAAIDQAVRRAVGGAGGVVVVEGPAGIGRSAVLDEARRGRCGSSAPGSSSVT